MGPKLVRRLKQPEVKMTPRDFTHISRHYAETYDNHVQKYTNNSYDELVVLFSGEIQYIICFRLYLNCEKARKDTLFSFSKKNGKTIRAFYIFQYVL